MRDIVLLGNGEETQNCWSQMQTLLTAPRNYRSLEGANLARMAGTEKLCHCHCKQITSSRTMKKERE